MPEYDLTVISLGAGVQSSAMLLMAEAGEIGPRPDAAIFADTGWEPKKIYEWLDWLESMTTIPIYRVSKGNLREDSSANLKSGKFVNIPFYTESSGKKEGMLRRQCSREYKIEVITQKIRQLLGLEKGQRAKGKYLVSQWIGISTDEASRMKDNQVKWLVNRYPLIEKGISRRDCMEWFEHNGYPEPSKSSCIVCPYRDDLIWRWVKRHFPAEFEEAVEFDRDIRGGVRGTTQKLYIHKSMRPLDEVDFDTLEDKGQTVLEFEGECEGMCGL